MVNVHVFYLLPDLNLVVADLLQLPVVRTLVRSVDVVVGANSFFLRVIHARFELSDARCLHAAAVGLSTMRQRELARLQRIGQKKPVKLKKRAATRWNSLHDVLERFLLLHDELLVMELNGFFKTCKSPVLVPLPDSAPKIQALVDELKVIKVYGRLLESREVFTLPHLPYIVHKLLSSFEDEREWQFAEIKLIRKSLYDSIKQRLGKHVNDPTQPSMLAAFLIPHYAGRLQNFGVAEAVGKAAVANLVQWFTDLQDGGGDANDENNVSTSIFLSPQPSRRLAPRDCVLNFMHYITSPLVLDSHPLPVLDNDGLKKQADETSKFYRNLPVSYRSIIPLVKCLLSGWGSSAGLWSK